MTWWWWFGCNSCSSKDKNILQNKQNACEFEFPKKLLLPKMNPKL